MAWLDDLLENVFGGGGGNTSTSQAVATGGSSTVNVSPTIINTLDAGPLAEPVNRLAQVFALSSAAQIETSRVQAEAIDRAATTIAASAEGAGEAAGKKLDQLATWVSIAAVVIGVLRLLK